MKNAHVVIQKDEQDHKQQEDPGAINLTLTEEDVPVVRTVKSYLTLQQQKLKDRTAINYKTTWNGWLNTFETFKCMLESWMVQHGMQYLLKPECAKAYQLGGWAQAQWHVPKDITQEQCANDSEILYGVLLSCCREHPVPNKYILHFESTANGIAAWDLFLQDYGSKNNLDVQKAEIDKELLRAYDPAQKGGILQYLDDTELAWVRMEMLDPCNMLLDKAKIRAIKNKLQDTEYIGDIIQANYHPEGKTLNWFLHVLQEIIKFQESNHKQACQVNAATTGYTGSPICPSNTSTQRKAHLSSQESFQTQDFQTQNEDSKDENDDDEARAFFIHNGYWLSKEAFALLKELSPEVLDAYMKAHQERHQPLKGNAASLMNLKSPPAASPMGLKAAPETPNAKTNLPGNPP